MQIFYYISMKCVENYYLVLLLEAGENRAGWEVGRLPSVDAQCRSSPLTMTPTFLCSTLGP